MSAPDSATMLLRAARRDLAALRAMGEPASFPDEIFGFHAQQVAEKALKALLAARGVAFPRTHDLAGLLVLLDENGGSPPGADSLVELNPFAVQYRYEAFDEADAPIDRAEILRQVEELVASVEKSLPSSSP